MKKQASGLLLDRIREPVEYEMYLMANRFIAVLKAKAHILLVRNRNLDKWVCYHGDTRIGLPARLHPNVIDGLLPEP